MSSQSLPEPKRRNGVVIVIVVAAVLAVLTAGGMWVWKNLGFGPSNSQTQEKRYEHAIDALTVDIDAGEIKLIADSQDDVITVERRLQWNGAKPKPSQEWDGDTLVIEQSGCTFGCNINYTIHLPADVDVDARTGAGDVTVVELAGKIDVRTGAGDVTATAVESAEIDAKSSAGNVGVDCAAVPRKVKADSDAGDVDVLLPRGDETYRVKADTEFGEPVVEVNAAGPDSDGSITAHSSAGDVTVDYR